MCKADALAKSHDDGISSPIDLLAAALPFRALTPPPFAVVCLGGKVNDGVQTESNHLKRAPWMENLC